MRQLPPPNHVFTPTLPGITLRIWFGLKWLEENEVLAPVRGLMYTLMVAWITAVMSRKGWVCRT